MGATPKYTLPYPEPADPADVPTDMRELAEAVEGTLGNGVIHLIPGGYTTLAGRSDLVTLDGDGSATITLGVTAANTGYVVVVSNGDAMVGVFMIGTYNQTTTRFTVRCWRDQTGPMSGNVRINWLAFLP